MVLRALHSLHSGSGCCFLLPALLLISLLASPVQAASSSAHNSWRSAADRLERLHSVVVVQDHEVVLSYHRAGPDTYTPQNIKSLSKSVLSLLTGIAIERDLIPGLDTPITELLGQHLPENYDPRLADITVEYLLTMQAGLQRTSGQYYGAWVNSDNWTRHALTRDFVTQPGTDMQYSTGNSHILAAILTEQTGQTLLELMRDWLGAPLRLSVPDWPRSPEGVHFGGNDMRLSARAVAHLGRIYLHDGRVNEHQFISREWIQQSFTPRTRSIYTDDPYGLGWFKYNFELTPGEELTAWYGRGYGGQLWYLFPDLGVSIAILSDPSPPSQGSYIRQIHQFVADALLPELVD